MKKREFAAEMKMLPEMLAFIVAEFAVCRADSRTVNLVKVSCEEVLANVISYAYAGTVGTVEIECALAEADDVFTLRITDDGAPYDPLTGDLPDIEAELDERQIGGLGVYLYTTIMDDVSYAYQNGKNILTLCKKISRKGS